MQTYHFALALVFHGGFMFNRVKKPWLFAVIAVLFVMWLGSCDTLAELFESETEMGGGSNNRPDGQNPTEPDPDEADALYVGDIGNDNENNGISKNTPFKTLAKAYTEALASLDRKRIIVLSDLGEDGLVTLDPTDKTVSGTDPVTIEGKTAGLKIERRDGVDDSVLEIKGGAQVVFENIKIDGISDDPAVYHRALSIMGTGTTVTLRDGVAVTGKITTSSGDVIPNDSDGSGILLRDKAELVMVGNSMVTECVTDATTDVAKGAVVVYDEGTLTMDDSAAVSNTTVTGIKVRGGGVYVYGSGSSLTMDGNAIVSDNTITGTETALGGGVRLSGGSLFTMNGGKISDNIASSQSAASSGGGIHIENTGSTFTMNDGVINGNTAENKGGGVYLAASGTFEMYGGVIYGNNTGDLSNTADINNGAAYYGNGGTVIPDTLITTDDTITVMGGGTVDSQ
jgi:hypothetical protein